MNLKIIIWKKLRKDKKIRSLNIMQLESNNKSNINNRPKNLNKIKTDLSDLLEFFHHFLHTYFSFFTNISNFCPLSIYTLLPSSPIKVQQHTILSLV